MTTAAFADEVATSRKPPNTMPTLAPSGNGAVAEEGALSNWEFAADNDVLLYNEEGYGMGVDPIGYDCCS